jgi:cell pole-organizing protein PopZ
MSDNTQEPTMEEILASIRRIISEDEATAEGEAPVAAAAPVAIEEEPEEEDEEEEEPLMLEEAHEAEPEPEPEPAPEPEVVHEPALPADDLDFVSEAPPPAPPPPSIVHAATPDPEPVPMHEPLVSAPAADTVANAFGALERSIMMPPGERSLEDVVREMLRPMLKTWLDENLPSIVQAQVAAEVERIARNRR